MDSEDSLENSHIQAEDNSIAIGGIQIGGNVDGNIVIGNNNQVNNTKKT